MFEFCRVLSDLLELLLAARLCHVHVVFTKLFKYLIKFPRGYDMSISSCKQRWFRVRFDKNKSPRFDGKEFTIYSSSIVSINNRKVTARTDLSKVKIKDKVICHFSRLSTLKDVFNFGMKL